jgi:uncharacterized protein YutE (UPF0331/DUF86 family)
VKQSEVQSKIDIIIDNIEKLNLLKIKTYEDFISDFRNLDSALHRLQTSIQALLDIGSYIVAFLGLKTPNTSAEIIEILKDAGYIPAEKAKTYITMAQFRNRIIHLYNHIDSKVLYDILTNELGNIKELFAILLKVIYENKG